MDKILKRLVDYGYEWFGVRGELPGSNSSYLGEEESELLSIIRDAEQALKGGE